MGFQVLYSIIDAKGKTSSMGVNLPTSVTLANAIDFASAMAVLVDEVIKGKITRIGLGFIVDLPGGLKTTPDADSDVEEGARFQFTTAGGFDTGFRIPTIDEAVVNPGSDTIDTTDAGIAAIITAMTTGIDVDEGVGVTLVQPCDTREDDVVALSFAREQFLSSRGRVG